MKYYIIAGEASGDLHASNLIKSLNKKDENADVRAWGGDLMEEQGATLVKHYRDLAFMGFAEVIMNLRTILTNISFCKKDILEYAPDVLILVDYPGFNLRIAEFAKEKGIKVFYYISPQVWAWKESRVKKIKRVVDKMFVILPFEKEFYKKHNYDVDFVGHPLLDAIANYNAVAKPLSLATSKPIVALLPGSREQEIKTMLPIMLSVVDQFKDYEFVIAGAPSHEELFYQGLIGDADNVSVVYNETYRLLSNAHAALVTSGTATLETALFGVPEVVCYKGNAISFAIAKQLVNIEYISLVNLVMDKEIVRELVQGDLNKKNLLVELDKILSPTTRLALLGNYSELKAKLGGQGASDVTANLMFQYLTGN